MRAGRGARADLARSPSTGDEWDRPTADSAWLPRPRPVRQKATRSHEEWVAANVVLVLGEIELGVGAGHLSTWADQAVLLVGAGKATAEFLRSISRMLTRSGPTLEFAMLVGADRTDESLGAAARVAADEPQRQAR